MTDLRRTMAWIAAVLWMAGWVLCAGPAAAQSRVRILGLSVVGNETSDAGVIRANSGLSVGQEATGDDIQTAIQQLWKLGLFSDIQILEERETDQGVYVAIHVKEYPRLERIDVKGNKKLKGDDLNSLLVLTKGQVVQPRELVLLKNRLQKKYAEMGYLLAEVDVRTYTSEQSGRVIVDVQIKEGRKVKIRRIEFTGNQAFTDRALRGKLKSLRQKSLFRSGEFKREKLEESRQSLVDFYRSKGYRDFELVSDSLRYSDDRRWIYLTFVVSEGPVYHYGQFTWSGNRLFTTDELRAKLRVEPGDVYNGAKFQQSLADVGTKYYEKGYIYATVNSSEKVREGHIVDVNLDVMEGSEFKVNRIFVEGNTKTKEKVVRRELVLFPGETFDVTKLQRSIREVTILNYFESVTPDVVPISDNQVDLYLRVKEKSTDQANVSAGYSQSEKFIGSVGFQMNNLLGNGQQLSLDWNFGNYYRSFSISFTEPWFRNQRMLVGASFYDTRRSGTAYQFTEDIIGGSVRVGRRLKWPDDYFRVDYIYRLDRTKYSNVDPDYQDRYQEGVARISSSLSQIISRDSRNDPEFPSTGSVNSLRLELTGGLLGGNDQFIKAQWSSQWYRPLVGQLVLSSESDIGALDGLTRNPRDIPFFDYYFMGGSGLAYGVPLRGYDDQEVGPQSAAGHPLGGKTMLKQSFELRYPVTRNPTIFVLGFAEAGNVWRNFEDTHATDLRRSVGLGVRLFMPLVGMIGLDYGLGLDHSGERGLHQAEWKPHFQFGRTF